MRGMVISILIAVIAAMGSVPVNAGSFEDAVAAHEEGDYLTAYALWLPLAQQGNAAAQFNLGNMFRNGNGVRQDLVEANRWYKKAAEQGHAWAQTNLGAMYANGLGVHAAVGSRADSAKAVV